ncbi:type 1 periplasmic-binding domain-containing protein [Rickettsia endosymbiont of Cardiosporidium cionae]|uniref:hypothetical protein n=1 Tax=Rickettsia endosymbiont of Cardiosporidium cionae TaxID=2777155 RepID=UPI0018934568|nr:hypothetical protein [Rickettsia endosymbiont of Cardiosporidium cionae]KAF8818440.1 hypothetical protein IHI24_000530 [Rickettsia endosymbiont of Cardiosporidium cionae]
MYKESVLSFIMILFLSLLNGCHLFSVQSQISSDNIINDTSKDAVYNKKSQIPKIALLIDKSESSESMPLEYSSMLKLGIQDVSTESIDFVSYDCSTDQFLIDAINKIIVNKVNIVVIGTENSYINQQVIEQLQHYQSVIMTVSNDSNLASRGVFVLGINPLESLASVVQYYLNKDYDNYLMLMVKSPNSFRLKDGLSEIIRAKGAKVVKCEFYSIEDLNKHVKAISLTVDDINEMDDNLNKPILIVYDNINDAYKIFNTSKFFSLDKKSIMATYHDANINSIKNFSITYPGAISDNLDQKASDIGVKRILFKHKLFYDIGKILSENVTELQNPDSFVSSIHNKEFNGSSGKISFEDFIAKREFLIIRTANQGQHVLD